ncbi:MAG: tRNA lysidine(34) synthetase TilS [Elusimicrobiota bacterium]
MRSYVKPGKKLLVAVSGGPDSVALAHLVKALPYPFLLAHVDHQLRKGSGKDRDFVRRLAASWDLPCVVVAVNVRAHGRKKNMGIEEAARELRYQALVKLARRHRCSAIMTGHHANDQAETVLMNYLRGAGPSGLAGIPPRRQMQNISLLRPLLKFPRQTLLDYLKQQGLRYRQDPTNRSLRYQRNRIRHVTLPYLERDYPGLGGRLGQSAEIFRQEEDFWDQIVRSKLLKTVRKNNKRIVIDLANLLGYHRALVRRIFRHVLPGLSFQEIERVVALAGSPNGVCSLHLGRNIVVERRAKQLLIFKRNS